MPASTSYLCRSVCESVSSAPLRELSLQICVWKCFLSTTSASYLCRSVCGSVSSAPPARVISADLCVEVFPQHHQRELSLQICVWKCFLSTTARVISADLCVEVLPQHHQRELSLQICVWKYFLTTTCTSYLCRSVCGSISSPPPARVISADLCVEVFPHHHQHELSLQICVWKCFLTTTSTSYLCRSVCGSVSSAPPARVISADLCVEVFPHHHQHELSLQICVWKCFLTTTSTSYLCRSVCGSVSSPPPARVISADLCVEVFPQHHQHELSLQICVWKCFLTTTSTSYLCRSVCESVSSQRPARHSSVLQRILRSQPTISRVPSSLLLVNDRYSLRNIILFF